jgi:hypothetical protein
MFLMYLLIINTLINSKYISFIELSIIDSNFLNLTENVEHKLF